MTLNRLIATAAFLVAPGPVAAQGTTLDWAPSQFAQYDGARVHYKSLGTGTTAVIFVHGWNGALEVWNAQIPVVTGKTRAIFVDLPGFGRSDKPEVAYTMDYFAGALDAVARAAGVERAVLVGHSLGTPVIRQFYRRYPAKVAGLVAVDGALRAFLKDTAQIRQFVARFEAADYQANVGAMFDGMLAAVTDTAARASVKRIALATPKHAAVSSMRWQVDPSVWGDDSINVPLLAVMAPNPGWNADYIAYVKRLAPGAQVELITGAGHFLMMDHASEFNALLTSFLKKNGVMP